MGTGTNGHLGERALWGKGAFGTNEHWDKWTFGKTGSLEQMGK